MNDLECLAKAVRYAKEYSDDGNTHAGAMLVTLDGQEFMAANWLPYGLEMRVDRMVVPTKYRWIEHAERAAIYRAAAVGARVSGSTLYCPWFACTSCARAIIGAGVANVVGLAVLRGATPERWEDDIRMAERMLAEAGVGMRWLGGTIGEGLLFDGKEIEL